MNEFIDRYPSEYKIDYKDREDVSNPYCPANWLVHNSGWTDNNIQGDTPDVIIYPCNKPPPGSRLENSVRDLGSMAIGMNKGGTRSLLDKPPPKMPQLQQSEI